MLLALDLYFQTYEKVTPDFVARVWLGNDYAGDHAFRGRTTEYYQVGIAMKDVAAHDKQALTIQKDGAGRLYYCIGMKYARHDLKIGPADYGFHVERRYEAVDDPKDVTRDKDGTWHIKAGARVRVKLNMVNENRRYHVALVDPMPAGFEAMNPALAVTGPIPQDPNQQKSKGAYWWWYGPWYEHQNLRDERVEAFASLLWEGVHTYEYVTRATTPGIAAKFAAWTGTGSVALLSSLVDSMVDAAASLVTFVAVRQALIPPDREHRFGHGKAEPLAALGQAAFLLGSASFLIAEAVRRLVSPEPIENTGIGVAVMLFSLGMTIGLVTYQRHVVQRTGSLAIGARKNGTSVAPCALATSPKARRKPSVYAAP